MEIIKSLYKDVFALQLKTKYYLAVVLPTHGGKIASFKKIDGDKEYLLQNNSKTYLSIDMDSDYVKGECCGFDDMFPTIDFISVKTPSGIIDYPDHGEICRIGFEYKILGDALELRYKSLMGYEYIKTFTDDCGKIRIDYAIKNVSDQTLDVLWAGHCLINAVKGGQVNVAFSEGEMVDVMFDISEKFKPLERVPYKKEYLTSRWEDGVKACNKFYFAFKSREGYIEYSYPEGDTFVMEFDNENIPYVGIWQNFGNINDSYCIGLEPCSVGYDTVENAEKYGQKCTIVSGESLNFFIVLSTR